MKLTTTLRIKSLASARQIAGTNVIAVLSAAALMTACGGGGDSAGVGTDGNRSLATVTSGYKPVAVTPTTTTPVTTSAPTAPVTGSALTDVRLENTGAAQTSVPFTFGQVFVQGQLKSTEFLTGRLDDGTTVPLQLDVKATHADGSVRHAIISGVLPALAANAQPKLSLVKSSAAPAGTVAAPAALAAAGFDFSVHAKIGGTDYYASAADLLKSGTPVNWLKGTVANEWLVSAPLRTSAGATHPHLTARFAVRWFDGVKKARIDTTIENTWAFEANPQNFTYDASVVSGGKQVYAKSGLTHYHHARWRKTFWWNGVEPQVNVKLNTAYLISTRAVPNYDQAATPSEGTLAGYQSGWTGAAIEPMGVGMALAYMPTTGGRSDIGIMPSWATNYLLSMDKRAKLVTLGTADLAGTWSMHYRDKKTDRPVSVTNYPYMTILGRETDSINWNTGKSEAFPGCAAATLCDTPYTHDSSHQPGFAYLPYLVTGDYYYLEELQFWTMYNTFESNPNYRQTSKGLYQDNQVRGQAWSMRTAAEAAYITPDNDALKKDLVGFVNNNLDWYNDTYVNNAATSNTFGALSHGYAYSYYNYTAIAPWQDDFFTSAIGHTAELGFTKAAPILAFKAKFPIQRMTTPGLCWIDAAAYTMTLRNDMYSPVYGSMAEVYKATHAADFTSLACNSQQMASYLKLKVGEMTGYSDSPIGYPSNMQPALAYAADVGGTGGKQAWALFMSRTVKPVYNDQPQFDILPR
ncbi:hypothetical protein [uncultured Massilia sp.]|uniref:RIFT barrel domain-containing protein n=1 Tax=uncultured Massilia sp. TaxID=169973 RepID=UPI0025FA5FA5|nr:hypothetical protein [uncultured Massilia sp.]